jgi:serpin B
MIFCSAVPNAQCKAPAPDAAPTAAADPPLSFAQGNNVFALNLYRDLRIADGNIFFSPFSIRTALAMTGAGAREETAAQIKNTLQFSLEGEALHKAFVDSITALNTGGGTDYEMSIANSLWGDKTSTFLQPFIEINKNFYGGALERLDFRNASENARLRINTWVEEQTRKKITNLLTPGSVSTDTRLVLVNAVYFKGLWTEPFDKKLTQNAPFYCVGGKTVNAPLMTFSTPQHLPFYKEDGLKVIELDYQGDDISMLIVLPDTADGLAAVEARLDEAALSSWIAAMKRRSVQVHLPRFTLTWGAHNIVPHLRSLGMVDAFNAEKADFSAIDGTRNLLISGVFHKAFVDVYEEGTEAAAATGVVVGVTSMPPPPEIFRADRPFLFFIREKATGAILFMGRLTEPEEN